jgi:hypothetical protein
LEQLADLQHAGLVTLTTPRQLLAAQK